ITVLAAIAIALYTRKVRKRRRRLAVLIIGGISIIAVIALLGPWHASPGTPRSPFGVRGAGPADGASLDIQTSLQLLRQGHVTRALFGLGPLTLARHAIVGPAYGPAGQMSPRAVSGLATISLELGFVGLAAVLGAGIFLLVLLLRRPPRPSGGFNAAMSAGVVGALVGNCTCLLWSPAPLLPLNLMGLAVAGGLGLSIARSRAQKTPRLPESRDLVSPPLRGPRPENSLGVEGRFRGAWLAILIGTSLAITAAGLSDFNPKAMGITRSDKLAHLFAFGLLGLLMCRVLEPRPQTLLKKADAPPETRMSPFGTRGTVRQGLRSLLWRPALAIMLVTAMGVALELGQLYMTEGRQFEYRDIAADFFGAVIMAGFWYLTYSNKVNRQAKEA
ncbi:MAG: hypothetical protein QGD94_07080, partial [Planctomycetia bacterium]|nr:hypothetical protein [Planctomycetia bacterium]